jgi:hypothetical protein
MTAFAATTLRPTSAPRVASRRAAMTAKRLRPAV